MTYSVLSLVLAATRARFSQIARMRVGDVQRAKAASGPEVARARAEDWQRSPPSGQGRARRAVAGGERAGQVMRRCWSAGGMSRAGRHRMATGRARAWQSRSESFGRGTTSGAGEDAGGDPLRAAPFQHRAGIRANLPIRLVAALHDTSVPMIDGTIEVDHGRPGGLAARGDSAAGAAGRDEGRFRMRERA